VSGAPRPPGPLLGRVNEGMAGRGPGKFIGFFRLVDACEQPGCPVCRCLVADARQYLERLLYEQVTDPGVRRKLYASWGFCNWHAWLLRETPDPAFGSAILSDDLLRLAIQRFERRADREVTSHRRVLGWLWRGEASRSLLARLYQRRQPCPGCRQTALSEAGYVRAMLQFIDDPELGRAYWQSHGLCVPHALRALELGGDGDQARQLVGRTLDKWRALRRDLQGFIGKHDHRNRQPFTEAEADAHVRALETLTGAAGVFGPRSEGERAAGRRGRTH
jgi:Family of unknown function (DUF6062)